MANKKARTGPAHGRRTEERMQTVIVKINDRDGQDKFAAADAAAGRRIPRFLARHLVKGEGETNATSKNAELTKTRSKKLVRYLYKKII